MDDARLRSLLDLSFDHLCTLPLRDFIDPDALVASLDQSATPERASYWQQRVFIPLRTRVLARAQASEIPLSAWFPPDIAASLAELLGEPAPLPRKAVDELVGSERVRDAVRTMLNDALTSFIARANAVVEGDASAPKGALRGALGWGAKAAAGFGKSMLGGIGDEIQKQLQGRVRDFVDSSVSSIQDRIAERLTSEDTARALGKRRRTFFEATLRKTESEVTRGARKAPFDKIDPWVPRLIAHNLGREALRKAMREEVRAVLDELSTESIGEVLDHSGLREPARAAFHRHLGPFVQSLTETEAFAKWQTSTP